MCLTIVRKLLRTWSKCNIDCLFPLCAMYLIMIKMSIYIYFLSSEQYQKVGGECGLDYDMKFSSS
jgi:hypothetical protein